MSDLVRATRDFPRIGINKGNAGRIVKECGPGIFELEFWPPSGRPEYVVAIEEWFERERLDDAPPTQ